MPIQVLALDIQQRIAAGEVIDRPASAVKELLENAIDAGARAIAVEVRNGGLDLIRVSDDGCGMPRTDAALALERFSTSKIRSLADLEGISSLGFRGEALSSLAAVAEVDILTRASEELEGTQVRSKDGSTVVEPAASPVGTSVSVIGLFLHVPARRRFLKSRTREVELIGQTVTRYALAYPQVAFRLLVDERALLALPPGTALARLGAVLGREVADEMLVVEWQALDLHVQGFISRPTIGRSRRSDQFFWINGRPVRAGLLAVMLERPYASLLPPGRHPLCALHIAVDPRYVDVNVHPQKAEVRFSQERAIYSALSSAVGEALSGFPRSNWESQPDLAWPFAGSPTPGSIGEAPGLYTVGSARVLAQLHRLYILAQTDDGLLIVDQHAAHEQVLFEKLSRSGESIALSPAPRIGLTPHEIEALERIAPTLLDLGFEVEPFGRQTFLICMLPSSLRESNAGELLTALIQEAVQHPDEAELRDRLAAKAACLGAVKAGDTLAVEQMQQLLDELAEVWSPTVCPHGRPAVVQISIDELHRRFGRS